MSHLLFILIIPVLAPVLGNDNFCQGRTGQFYPYMADCTKYYQCAAGITYLRDCGPGTKWNQAAMTCGWVCDQSHPELDAESAATTKAEAKATTKALQTTAAKAIETTTELQTTIAEAIETTTELQTTTAEAILSITELQTTTSATAVDVPSWACGKKVLVPNEDRIFDCPVITEITVITRIHCLDECVVHGNCTCVNFKKSVLGSNCLLLHCAGQTYTATPSPNTVALCL
ncbi:hypothetical protein SNE40_000698 [Patella caerulea]|uniref:Chitin-binding type-2 domain-containing protein n=1 Tax=Patella caerulea TaxID=87958 RepID=A0AAN8KKF4_PATCE